MLGEVQLVYKLIFRLLNVTCSLIFLLLSCFCLNKGAACRLMFNPNRVKVVLGKRNRIYWVCGRKSPKVAAWMTPFKNNNKLQTCAAFRSPSFCFSGTNRTLPGQTGPLPRRTSLSVRVSPSSPSVLTFSSGSAEKATSQRPNA